MAILVILMGVLPASSASGDVDTVAQEVRVLSAFPTGRDGLQYELTLGPCGNNGPCPVSIRLARNSKVTQTQSLEWDAPSKGVQLRPVAAGWGVGDVLRPLPGLKGWTAAIEDSGDGVVARPVKLTRARIGLLVTQRLGVEPVKRWHALFIVDHGRLKRAWEHKDAAGPSWSTSRVMPLTGDRQQVMSVEAYRSGSEGDGDRPDRLEAQTLSWDEQQDRLAEEAARETTPLQMVWFGPFRTAAAANAIRLKRACLYDFYILDAGRYDGLPPGYVIGTVTSEPQLARAKLREAASCSGSTPGHAVPYKLKR